MTLGDLIKSYRTKNKMSMDRFSELSGISKAYISLLEKNKHPKTGKPIIPSIQTIKQAANAMNIDFNELFGMIDSDVSLVYEQSFHVPTPKILQSYNKLNDLGKQEATKRVEELTHIPKYKDNQLILNAAHAIPGANEEEKQFDNDIMNDENF